MAKQTITKVRRRKTGGQSRAYSRRGYMRGRSRDDDASKMVEKLERMMEQTSDPSVKRAIQQAVESLDM